MNGAAIKGYDLCNRTRDPYCVSFSFGEEILLHPEIRASIESWLLHFCERVPREVDDKTTLYYELIDRQRAVKKLRYFMGCDGAPREPRNIYFYVVRNFDDVFSGDSDHADKVLKQSVIDERVVRLNQ